MLRGVFLRWLIGICSVVAVVGFALYAVANGYFGPGLKSHYWILWETAKSRKDDIDLSLKIVGLCATLASLAWGILKAWHFAEHKMPERMVEFLERNDTRLEMVRPALLDLIDGRAATIRARAPIGLVGPMNDGLKSIGYPVTGRSIEVLTESIAELTKQIAISERRKAQMKAQLATAHLLRGSLRAALGGAMGRIEGRPQDIDAAGDFDECLKHDTNDVAGLLYRGLHSLRHGDREAALADFTTVMNLPAEPDSVLRRRAFYQAATIYASNDPPNRGIAATLVDIAATDPPNGLRQTIELAEMRLFAGEVWEAMAKRNRARERYLDAERIVEPIPGDEARRIKRKAKEALERLSLGATSVLSLPVRTDLLPLVFRLFQTVPNFSSCRRRPVPSTP